MKNRSMKLFLATTLCVAMAGTTCFATDLSTPTGGEITGDNTVESPIYRVVVPTTLTYAIDAFEQKGQSQIYSDDLSIINKSNVNVKVDTSVTLVPKAGVTLQQTAAEVSEADDSKNLYFAAAVPSAVTPTEEAAAAYAPVGLSIVTGTPGTYYKDKATADAVLGSSQTMTVVTDEMVDTTAVVGTYTKAADVALAAEPTKLTFALKAADYVTYFDDATDVTSTASQYKAAKNTTGDAEGSATFRFTGTVNTKASWAAADLTTKVAYSFIGLSDANYTALMAKQVEIDDTTKAHGYVQEAPANAAPSIAGTVSTVAVGTSGSWTVNLGNGTLASTGIFAINKTSSGALLKATNYTLAGNTLTILNTTTDTELSFDVTFNDAAKTKIRITVARP